MDIVRGRNSDNSALNSITLCLNPSTNNYRIIFNSPFKIFLLSSFVLSILSYRSYIYFKKLLLWPFKLGLFSFVYSVLGFDVKSFLSFFDFFSLNIPHWVYLQYITLYNNWLYWWYNTVNIKCIKTPIIITKTKEILGINSKPNTPALELDDNKNINYTKVAIIVSVVIIFGVVIYIYYPDVQNKFVDFITDLFPDGGRRPKPRSSPPTSGTELINIDWRSQRPAANSEQFGTSTHVEPSGSGSSSSVRETNVFSNQTSVWSQPEPRPSNPTSVPNLNDPWDGHERSSSPTGSDTSSSSSGSNSTITPSNEKDKIFFKYIDIVRKNR